MTANIFLYATNLRIFLISKTAKEMTEQQKQDSKRLRTLADWFDTYDAKNGNIGMNEVQTSLREIADRIESILSPIHHQDGVSAEDQNN